MAHVRNAEGKISGGVTVTAEQAAARQLYADRQNKKFDWIEARKLERAGMTPQAKLKHLDVVNGKGVGAAKERKKLQAQIDKAAASDTAK